MSDKEILELIGGLFALLAYPFFAKMIRDNPEKYNSTTMFLWCFIDAIAGISMFLEGGNYILAGLFVVGSYSMGVILWSHRKITFGEKEIIIFAMVICCIGIWFFSSNIWATIASTTATILAGVPQFLDSRKKPDRKSTHVWLLFFAGGAISFFAGKDWDFESFIITRLFPLANAIMALGMIWVSLKTKRRY